jgi:RNA polymerase sigma-70 factor, ECF subfamily
MKAGRSLRSGGILPKHGITALQRPVLADSTTHDPARRDHEPRSPDDRELARRAARGDMLAFEVLYRRHAGRVLALCLRLTGERTRAEEAMQDVFVRLWERMDSFRGESAFTSWLHRLTVNTVLLTMRSDKRRIARVEATDDEQLRSAPAVARSAEDQMDLDAALQRLPEHARRIVVLHDIEWYTHEEIAELTGVPAGTIRSQLSRARRTLLQWLER